MPASFIPSSLPHPSPRQIQAHVNVYKVNACSDMIGKVKNMNGSRNSGINIG